MIGRYGGSWATATRPLYEPGVDVEVALVPVTPLGRLGRPADVADIVAFLTGHDERWVAGQNLRASDDLP